MHRRAVPSLELADQGNSTENLWKGEDPATTTRSRETLFRLRAGTVVHRLCIPLLKLIRQGRTQSRAGMIDPILQIITSNTHLSRTHSIAAPEIVSVSAICRSALPDRGNPSHSPRYIGEGAGASSHFLAGKAKNCFVLNYCDFDDNRNGACLVLVR